jgi:hypothetical protein
VPEANAGIYVAYGASGGDVARDQLAKAFFDRYFPASEAAAVSPATPPPLDRYAGAYRVIRMNYTNIDKVIWAFLPPTRITVLANGRLQLTGGLGPGAPGQFVPLSGHLFREVGGDRTIGFGVDSSGRATHLFTNPTVDNERVPWNESRSLWYPLLIAATLILLGALVGLWYRRQEVRAMPSVERRALWLSGIAALELFVGIIAIGVVILAYQQVLLERIPFALKAALLIPVVFGALTLALVANTVRAWRRRFWAAGRRVHYTIVTLAAIVVSWFFYQWNILGWHFG